MQHIIFLQFLKTNTKFQYEKNQQKIVKKHNRHKNAHF